LVLEHFSEVENKNVVVPDLSEPKPFTADNLGFFTRYVPIQDKDRLQLYWVLPDCHKEYLSNPLSYFSHLFGHEGQNSLLSYLKKEGLALELSCGSYNWIHSFNELAVTILLTKKGLSNYYTVLAAVFKFAQRLVEVGPQEKVFEEIKQISQIDFDFASKSSALNYCVKLSKNM
jgi:insulysin